MSTISVIHYCVKFMLILSCLFTHFQTKAQTKQETIEWINSKFNKNPTVFGEYFKRAQRMKIYSDGTFEITRLNFEFPLNEFNPKIESTTILKGNFKNFSPNSVTTRIMDRLLFIDINCFNNNCISVSQSGENLPYIAKEGVTFGAFDTDENRIEERLKKAFIHLIILCGGKKEAF